MKRTVWIMAATLIAGSILGCGAKEKSSNATSAAGNSPAATEAKTQHVSFKSSTPEEAVTEFLDALRSGNEKTAEALLTTRAREETAAHDMVVEPPGAPNASYSVGRVQHPDGQADAAYVSSVWSEKEGQVEDSYEVVWILRKETTGWRIAGMATQLTDSQDPVFLNFEDLSELENAVREAEVANRPGNTPPAPESGSSTLR